jgi:protein arginine kinase activator
MKALAIEVLRRHDTAERWPFSMAWAIFKNVTCVQCGEREALVFIRRRGEGGEGCDMALCESCAKGRGISAGKGSLELSIDDLIGDSLESPPGPGSGAFCPSCGLDVATLRREGRLGCAGCADAFFDEISKAVGRGTAGRPREPAIGRGFAASAFTDPEPARLRSELEAAIASEDYEKAARLRDELALSDFGAAAPPEPPSFSADFAYDPRAFLGAEGAEDDVALSSSAIVYRDIADLPFPGSPRGPSSPSRAALLEKILSYGRWRSATMAELGPVARRSLSERGIVPRGYAADDEAVLLSSASRGVFALLDEGDHLRVRSVHPGLDARGALGQALALADRLETDLGFARKDGIGWICSRVSDCGLACSVSATMHIPAIVAAGMRDRLFRSLMSDGVSIRGSYSSGEESAGSVYELSVDPSGASSIDELAGGLDSAAAKVIAAERRAREEIAEKGRDALVDAEGRAFGIARHCRLLGADEAASVLSVLRLAALRASLSGADHRIIGSLLPALGPGSVALSSGLREIPPAATLDFLRARIVKDALALAEYRVEEGA